MARKKQTTEELIAGLRRRGGHLPTKLSEAEHERREKERKKKLLKNAKFE
jgi:hypothetical protein